MAEVTSELPQSSEGDATVQSGPSIKNLLHELRAYRRSLEKPFIDTFQDFANRLADLNTEVYNERAVLLSQKKEEFFGLTNALVDKCEAYEDGQFEEVIDNCDLFKVKLFLCGTSFYN